MQGITEEQILGLPQGFYSVVYYDDVDYFKSDVSVYHIGLHEDGSVKLYLADNGVFILETNSIEELKEKLKE
jgi:hypothetical protein